MRHVGHLEGQGHLSSSLGTDFGLVEYAIDLNLDPATQRVEGTGWLCGDDKALRNALWSEGILLQLSTGEAVPVIVAFVDSTGASIKTVGPVPGFEPGKSKRN
jgi:hypothetical protein